MALKHQPAIPKADPVIEQLKLDMAYYLTQLDLADAGLRVYTCGHKSFSSLQDSQNETRVKPMWLIANQMFDDWKADAEFMSQYKSCRAQVLKHHRAHELQNNGRGDRARNIKDHCNSHVMLVRCYVNKGRSESRQPSGHQRCLPLLALTFAPRTKTSFYVEYGNGLYKRTVRLSRVEKHQASKLC